MQYEVEIEALEDVGLVAVEASAHGLARTALALGAALPDGARAVAIRDGVLPESLLHRCGPEALILMTGIADAPPLAARLGDMLAEASAIVADLSDGHGWVRLAGLDARSVLAQGVAIDLRDSALDVGDVARTLCFGVEVILHREGTQSFRIGCRASHAEFLLARLELAGAPAGEAKSWR